MARYIFIIFLLNMIVGCSATSMARRSAPDYISNITYNSSVQKLDIRTIYIDLDESVFRMRAKFQHLKDLTNGCNGTQEYIIGDALKNNILNISNQHFETVKLASDDLVLDKSDLRVNISAYEFTVGGRYIYSRQEQRSMSLIEGSLTAHAEVKLVLKVRVSGRNARKRKTFEINTVNNESEVELMLNACSGYPGVTTKAVDLALLDFFRKYDDMLNEIPH